MTSHWEYRQSRLDRQSNPSECLLLRFLPVPGDSLRPSSNSIASFFEYQKRRSAFGGLRSDSASLLPLPSSAKANGGNIHFRNQIDMRSSKNTENANMAVRRGRPSVVGRRRTTFLRTLGYGRGMSLCKKRQEFPYRQRSQA